MVAVSFRSTLFYSQTERNKKYYRIFFFITDISLYLYCLISQTKNK